MSYMSIFPPAGSAWNEAIDRITNQLESGEIQTTDIKTRLIEEINKSALNQFYKSLIIAPFFGIIIGIFLSSLFGAIGPINQITYVVFTILSVLALIIVVIYLLILLRKSKAPN